MIRSFLIALLPVVLFFTSEVKSSDDLTENTSTDNCGFDRSEMLSLDLDRFDQDMQGGWREVSLQNGCELAAADLIRDYAEQHDIDNRLLTFHEGQMRASAGQTTKAIELIRSTMEPKGESRIFGWNEYVDATIAFLEKDKDSLVEARNALVEIPKPSGLKAIDREGNPVEIDWPPNINTVNGFVRCFSDDYKTAYNNCSGLPPKKDTNDR